VPAAYTGSVRRETQVCRYAEMRRAYRERREHAEQERIRLLARAQADASGVVDMIAREYQPDRIYQWGSLVETAHFSERSDIDIAVEGITDPNRFFAMAAAAQEQTRFPLDIVQLETVHPRYAELIRRLGRLVYERDA